MLIITVSVATPDGKRTLRDPVLSQTAKLRKMEYKVISRLSDFLDRAGNDEKENESDMDSRMTKIENSLEKLIKKLG